MSSNEVMNPSSAQLVPQPKFSKTQFQESVFKDSVFSEVTSDAAHDSAAWTGVTPARKLEKTIQVESEEKLFFPMLGAVAIAKLLRSLYFGLALFLSITFTLSYYAFQQSQEVALHVRVVGELLVQGQRMVTAANQALVGQVQGFEQLRDSVSQLKNGISQLDASPAFEPFGSRNGAFRSARRGEVVVVVDRSVRAVGVLLEYQALLTGVSTSLQKINTRADDVLEAIRFVVAGKSRQNASPAELAALAEMAALSQRVAKSANEFLTAQGLGAQSMARLRQDMAALESINAALLNGDAQLRLGPTKEAALREQIVAVAAQLGEIRTAAQQISDNFPRLVQARAAQESIAKDGDTLRTSLGALGATYLENQDVYADPRAALAVAATLSMLSIAALLATQFLGARQRKDLAVQRALEAQELTKVTQQVNDAIQEAILRLMNELQAVAEGDLTRQATVTEDITGAIADSINYTVEELRVLVTNVQITADRVAKTTAQVGASASAQLTTSNQQLREIRQTGLAVLEMAGRINEVSSRAQQSAEVARQSLQASSSGLLAVQNTMGGMNTLRDQIQETSKRIKRLGESSQEISEITEIISDITEQTNVLALNAAIQAASAGESGRGFAVVAEEVQRLAVRSAQATQQIATIVRGIQTDTQDAISAMERSAQGVVAGATLSDNAGSALIEIDQITRRVADQVEQISATASREASLANDVAKSIQNIFAVTEQTEKDNLATTAEVQRLAAVANELRKSVTRFKVS